MKLRTNFDVYIEDQLKDPDFAERFEKAGDAWDVALQLAALREEAGLSQKELARRVGTSQQQISHRGETMKLFERCPICDSKIMG
ncbi:MAG: helix-turn-helix transcriptional regulator [Thermodesulfobacteriota bacterium]